MIGELETRTRNLCGTLPDASDDSLPSEVKEPFVFYRFQRGHHGLPGGKRERVMRGRYLEVTFRKGRAIAAYLYLPRRGAERAARVSKAPPAC